MKVTTKDLLLVSPWAQRTPPLLDATECSLMAGCLSVSSAARHGRRQTVWWQWGGRGAARTPAAEVRVTLADEAGETAAGTATCCTLGSFAVGETSAEPGVNITSMTLTAQKLS